MYHQLLQYIAKLRQITIDEGQADGGTVREEGRREVADEDGREEDARCKICVREGEGEGGGGDAVDVDAGPWRRPTKS